MKTSHYITLVLLATFGVAACGEDSQKTTTQVAPSSPTGRITGQVLDAKTFPLKDVEVKISGGDTESVKTDVDGLFTISGIAERSQVLVIFTKAGFAEISLVATIDHVVVTEKEILPIGDSMTFVGPVVMFPDDYSITFRVIDQAAAPVAAFTASLRVEPVGLDMSSNFPLGKKTITATGSDGMVTFTNVPDPVSLADFVFYVGPERPEFTYSISINGLSGGMAAVTERYAPWQFFLDSAPLTLVVPYFDEYTESPEIEATNVWWLDEDAHPPMKSLVSDGAVQVVFERPIEHIQFTVWGGPVLGNRPDAPISNVLPPPIASQVKGNRLTIPTSGFAAAEALTPGSKYYLKIQAMIEATTENFDAAFYIGSPSVPMRPTSATFRVYRPEGTAISGVNAQEAIYVDLDQDVGAGSGWSNSFPIFATTDIDASGHIGDTRGEQGNATPLACADDESALYGGAYTRFFNFRSPVALPAETMLAFFLNRPELCTEVVRQETVWGELVSSLPNPPASSVTAVALPASP